MVWKRSFVAIRPPLPTSLVACTKKKQLTRLLGLLIYLYKKVPLFLSFWKYYAYYIIGIFKVLTSRGGCRSCIICSTKSRRDSKKRWERICLRSRLSERLHVTQASIFTKNQSISNLGIQKKQLFHTHEHIMPGRSGVERAAAQRKMFT